MPISFVPSERRLNPVYTHCDKIWYFPYRGNSEAEREPSELPKLWKCLHEIVKKNCHSFDTFPNLVE